MTLRSQVLSGLLCPIPNCQGPLRVLTAKEASTLLLNKFMDPHAGLRKPIEAAAPDFIGEGVQKCTKCGHLDLFDPD